MWHLAALSVKDGSHSGLTGFPVEHGALLSHDFFHLSADRVRPDIVALRGEMEKVVHDLFAYGAVRFQVFPADVHILHRTAREFRNQSIHVESPVYTLDLCASADVSERTLRTVFREYFGMGPMQYLKLHRLQQVRRALCADSPNTSSVKSIALAHGFWELGRFAADYRRLFGESPAETLHSTSRPWREGGNLSGTQAALDFRGIVIL